MHAFFLAFTLVLGTMGAKVAPQQAVMATIHQFFDSLNKGDLKTALAACGSPAVVIDEIPPHAWQGATACADWANDFVTAAKQQGITSPDVTLSAPVHVDIDPNGDRAYAVVPATYAFQMNGKPQSEDALFTATLQKTAAGWRMTGWAWSRK